MNYLVIMRKMSAWVLVGFTIIYLDACEKLLDVPPASNQLTSEQVYANDSMARLANSGLHLTIMKAFSLLNGLTSKFAGLSADELSKSTLSTPDTAFLFNNLKADDPTVAQFWTLSYTTILNANSIIAGLSKSPALSSSTRAQLSGDARVIRALMYFYLSNFFGKVPLVLSTNYNQTALQPQASIPEIYQQIILDLQTAQADLPSYYGDSYLLPSSKTSATRWAATALLARVYLYRSDFINAEIQASSVINSGLFQLTGNLDQVFLATSPETILHWFPAPAENNVAVYNTGEGGLFLPASPSTKPPCPLTDTLLRAFELNDARKDSWIKISPVNGQSYPYKYRVYTSSAPFAEYNIVLRLAEQLLIRAEARARLGKLAEAAADLNVVRERARLADISPTASQQEVLALIEHERRIELFAEWGHRWFDLNRLPSESYPSDQTKTRSDDILANKKGVYWQSYKKRLPIPAQQLVQNKYLIQNEGY